MEHILPVIRGGATDEANLALSCAGCNGSKYDRVEAFDPISQTQALLYNPRRDDWREHFAWDADYIHLVGLTPTGRATILALHLNRSGVLNLRGALFVLGLHPPEL